MRPLAALLVVAALASPAAASENRGTRIAMAVALLDVADDYCEGRLKVDEKVKATLFAHFHEYDIAGLASLLSRPLNSFYEDFSYQAKQGRDAFCRKAPQEAARTGYPVLLAEGG
ncbi:hypothetical protein DK847_02320 [Aestuariivirga litoralis]|uniref:Uncharacterized protein n=1 Tax=Aestuariivirga litoralis TaxID=2650924 RepID=A0A2W2BR10_9HYPH|nr:hypothetical protein [Aestuariivirga litoralis]PZF78659.1 hypothetical protein DK847_02320 [Aestuariivirga litoralis]